MNIIIKPRQVECSRSWTAKGEGVILVENESNIKPLYDLLVEQDEYWEGRMNLIKVAPKEVNHESDLDYFCEYVGKTDIYEVELLRSKVPFIIYFKRNYEY